MDQYITVTIDVREAAGRRVLAPTGLATPYQVPTGLAVDGGDVALIFDATGSVAAALITPTNDETVTLRYGFAESTRGAYPEAIFRHQDNRFTRAAQALASDARAIADQATDGHAAIQAIVNDTAQKFTYGHPLTRFTDGSDEVPHLGCGVAEGSCVDINTYLIAALRAAGFHAGYVTGYFFPVEKGNWCEDGHCWVVTRHQGVTLEWDIAHHLKMGTREICCGLNPKPGHRIALAHSLGLDFPQLGLSELKLLSEAVFVDGNGGHAFAPIAITCDRADARPEAVPA